MPFTFPEGLAPEVYPLAWLVGTWNGGGVIDHPAIGRKTFTQRLTFDHDGGPYLRFESTLRDDETVWSTETGYWRVSTERPDGLEEDRHPLEVVVADAAGRMTLYVGAAARGRIDLASDAMARTASSADVRASKRMYGMVEGRLMWVEELAAFGEPLRDYASAELDRE